MLACAGSARRCKPARALVLAIGGAAGLCSACARLPISAKLRCVPRVRSAYRRDPDRSTRAYRPRKSKALITVPIEIAVNGVPDLATLRSKSVLGLSSVTILVIERGTDP